MLEGLGIQSSHHTTLSVQKQVLDRIKQNEAESSTDSKHTRKLEKTAKQDLAEHCEGVTYGPGTFNPQIIVCYFCIT